MIENFTLDLNSDTTDHPSDQDTPPQGQFIPSDSTSLDRGTRSRDRSVNSYVNKEALALDLRALANMPELCDVTFLVGQDRQPVCGVRAILAARSR